MTKKDNKQIEHPTGVISPVTRFLRALLECTHFGWLILHYRSLATPLGQEKMFLSFLNTSRWLCLFAVAIMEQERDKDWK